MIDASTVLIALLGHPVEHSLSPRMHNYIYAHAGINSAYLAFDVSPEKLQDAVNGLRALAAKGFNVTVPHKQSVIPYMDSVDNAAAIIGAVNTVANNNGRLIGYNTDATGFLRSLEYHNIDVKDKSVLVIGAGGAARAVAVALSMAGARIIITNRTFEKADELANSISSMSSNSLCTAAPLNELKKLDSPYLLVNATSAGMWPHIETSPLPEDYDLSDVNVAYDLVYNPIKTTFLQEAEKSGCTVVNGLDMLIFQAIEAIRIWFNSDVPYDIAKNAVKDFA